MLAIEHDKKELKINKLLCSNPDLILRLSANDLILPAKLPF